jgi:hypothetical protein
MIGLDSGNTCPLPLDMSDDELQNCHGDPKIPCGEIPSTDAGALSGFIAFARLCSIFRRIYRLCLRGRHLRQNHLSARSKLLRRRQQLQQKLEEWMLNLPSSLSISPDKLCDGSKSTAHRTMFIIISVMHSAAVIHLHA